MVTCRGQKRRETTEHGGGHGIKKWREKPRGHDGNMGVFHLPKDSGKFRKLRWEMFIGEGRVLFDTSRPIHSQAPFTI